MDFSHFWWGRIETHIPEVLHGSGPGLGNQSGDGACGGLGVGGGSVLGRLVRPDAPPPFPPRRWLPFTSASSECEGI